MKKLVLSLLTAATLATASNAMALQVAPLYTVTITTGGLETQTFAGMADFTFDSEFFNFGTSLSGSVLPGSCVYSMQWINVPLAGIPASGPVNPALGVAGGTLALSAQGFLAEQMSEGNGSCLENTFRAVPSVVTLADVAFYGPSFGFDPFGQIDTIGNIQLGESFAFAPGLPALSGVVSFANSGLIASTLYGITFAIV